MECLPSKHSTLFLRDESALRGIDLWCRGAQLLHRDSQSSAYFVCIHNPGLPTAYRLSFSGLAGPAPRAHMVYSKAACQPK